MGTHHHILPDLKLYHPHKKHYPIFDNKYHHNPNQLQPYNNYYSHLRYFGYDRHIVSRRLVILRHCRRITRLGLFDLWGYGGCSILGYLGRPSFPLFGRDYRSRLRFQGYHHRTVRNFQDCIVSSRILGSEHLDNKQKVDQKLKNSSTQIK